MLPATGCQTSKISKSMHFWHLIGKVKMCLKPTHWKNTRLITLTFVILEKKDSLHSLFDLWLWLSPKNHSSWCYQDYSAPNINSLWRFAIISFLANLITSWFWNTKICIFVEECLHLGTCTFWSTKITLKMHLRVKVFFPSFVTVIVKEKSSGV